MTTRPIDRALNLCKARRAISDIPGAGFDAELLAAMTNLELRLERFCKAYNTTASFVWQVYDASNHGEPA